VCLFVEPTEVKPLDFEMLREFNIPWNENERTFTKDGTSIKLNEQEVRKDLIINVGSALEGDINKDRAKCFRENYTRFFYAIHKTFANEIKDGKKTKDKNISQTWFE
jgi:hypothetical protein